MNFRIADAKMTLGVVHLFQVGFVGDCFDARPQRNDLIVAGRLLMTSVEPASEFLDDLAAAVKNRGTV